MLEVFKFVVLCLICTIFTALFSTVLLTTLLFIVLTVLFYDFDFETPFERHAINKIKHAYLKVRNIHQFIYPNINNSKQYICTPNMSNINKTKMDFDLSRFNRSGSVFSPISRIGGSSGSRRLPTLTSTPLTRNSPWQKNSTIPVKPMSLQSSTIIRSPRYSLSSSNDNSNDDKSGNQSPTVQTVAGPLLASTRFNINLGTYTDTKSPGLASRVVQYHNESISNEATHQSKYKSPGQFPIVQLYKKKLPLLTRSPKRCTVRVAPPDCLTYNSPQGNTILRDTFVQRNAENNRESETEINTKSVLDALKEISRKRIHANDDLDDISKRQRKGSVTNTDNTNKDGKRLREDTPPKPKGTVASPSTNKPKKICVTDEIECSLSSSILMRQQGQKRKAGISGEKTTKVVKQRKISGEGNHMSRETQTNVQTDSLKSVTNSTQTNFTEGQQIDKPKPSFQKKSINEKPSEEMEYTGLQQILQNAKRKKKQHFEKSIEEIDDERSSVQFNESQPYKPLFSHEPMEIIMKNRLEVAMAALNGANPEIIPLPRLTLTQMLEKTRELAQKQSSNSLKESKALTSILSPKNKTKHDKHVSFDIPVENSNTENEIQYAEVLNTNESNINTPSNLPASNLDLTSEKSPFGAQISFGAVTNTTISNNTTPTPLVKETLQPTTAVKFGENKINFGGDASPKTLVFGQLTPSSAPNSIASTPSVINFSASNNISTANLPFSTSSNNNTTPSFGNIPPKSSICSDPNTQMSSSFGTSNVSKTVVPFGAISTISSTSTTISSSQNMKPNISFGTSQPISFGATTSSISAPIQSSNTFGTPTQITQDAITFGTPTQTTQSSVTFGTPTQTNQSSVNFGTPTPITQSSVTFGAMPQTTSLGSFGTPAQTTSSVTFGTPVTTTNTAFNFGSKSEGNQDPPSFNFGGTKSPPKTGGFKFDLGKPAIDASKTTNFSDNSVPKPPAFAFGSTNNTSALPVFGANTSNSTPALEGTLTTSVPNFGAVSTTQSAPTFGAVSTTQSAPIFGSNPDTKPVALFGAPTPNTTTSTQGFGLQPTTNTTISSVFGSTTNTLTFGEPKTTDNKPAFAFGTNTTQSSAFGAFTPTTMQNSGFAFGGNQPKPTTTAGTSTSSNTFSFGGAPQNNKPFSFNAPTTTASNVFGGTNPPPAFGAQNPSSGVFGTPTTTSGGVFGTPNTTNLTSNVFGAPTTTSTGFGANTTTSTANTFGQPSSGGFGSNTSGFGGTPVNGSVFGTQNNNNNNSNTFGGTTTSNTSFGAPNQTAFASGTASNVFGGSSGAQSNVFGSPSGNKPAFGGSNTTNFTSFGNTNTPTPTFGGNPAPTNSNVFGSNTNQSTTFGATNNNNNNNSNNNQANAGGFGSFGAANQTQQQGVFAFGGNAPNSGTNAFQFAGSSTPAKPSGFNFSTSTTTPNLNFTGGNSTPSFGGNPPPAFGAPNTGMFNIGSGSTAAKQRPMIKARRRNN